MIKFSLPGYWLKYDLNLCLLNIYENERYKFYDDIVIDSFYDSIPCIWNGGRYIEGTTNIENMKATFATYNDKNISLRHTFTNCLITETDLQDSLCNMICQLSESELNGVNYNSTILGDYIKTNYSKFYTLLSTTLNIMDIETINQLSQNELVVIDYRFNNNFEQLQRLSHPNNIEILVGEACQDDCPHRQYHYISSAENQKYLALNNFVCPFNCDGSWDYYNYIPVRNHYISIEDIREKYMPLGLTQFKISGRKDSNINNIERYVNYLVKPEYKDEIRNRLLLTMYG